MIGLELYDEFHEASKLTGDERLSKVEEYAILERKSNLLEYTRFHLSPDNWNDMESFIDDIRRRGEEIRQLQRIDYLNNRAEWREFDPTHLIACAQASDESKWLVPLLKNCTKALEESPYYTYLTNNSKSTLTKKVRPREWVPGPIEFEIDSVREKFREEGGNESGFMCPNDGLIVVDVAFGLDGPKYITGIEYIDRLCGADDSVPSLAEATVQEYVDSIDNPWSGNYNSIFRIFSDD